MFDFRRKQQIVFQSGCTILHSCQQHMRVPVALHPFECLGGAGLVAKSCLTLVTLWTVACWTPLTMGFFQARTLEWVATSFSSGSSETRDRTQVSCAADSLLHCRQILYPLSHQGSPRVPCEY